MKAFLISALAISLFSCNAIREAHQSNLDKKAVGRVLSSANLTNQVYTIAVGLHPIIQKPVLVKGKDSIIYQNIPVDVVRDSLIKKECPLLNLDSLKNALHSVEIHFNTDTLIVPDTTCARELDIINDNLQQKIGQYNLLVTSDAAMKSSKSKLTWWLIGVSFIALLIIAALIYLKI